MAKAAEHLVNRSWCLDPKTPGSYSEFCKHLEKLVYLAEEFKWLSDAYLSDFFYLDHWQKVKPLWRNAFESMDLSEIASFLGHSKESPGTVRNVWPLSIMAYRACAHSLSLPRVPLQSENLLSSLKSHKTSTDSVTESETIKATQDRVISQHMELDHCFRRHVKPKKQHEILILAKTIHNLCSMTESSHVIDVGAGQGHLCRLLSYGYGLNVTTIEATGCHVPKAQKFDKEVERDASRSLRNSMNSKEAEAPAPVNIVENAPEPSHVVAWIDADITEGEFLRHVIQAQEDRTKVCQENQCDKQITSRDNSSDLVSETPKFTLTGLHACGDLTPTLLRVFVQCPQAVSLASVGCCYMKMDIHLKERGHKESGYPMSQFLKKQQFNSLSWEAREMACHFLEAYKQRLSDAVRDPDGDAMAHLRTHCYRATLQEIIMKKDPQIEHSSIKLTLKKGHRLAFEEYATKALKRLGLDPGLTEDMIQQAETRLKDWKNVVAFYTLRLVLAPVFESIILLDRMLYLAEKGISSSLVPVFDPTVSPRNVVLVAAK